MEKIESPFLEGNFAPWRSEDNIDDLEVIGNIPEDLNGVLLRNGPNPQFDPVGAYHWFSGDGMLHAIRLKNGDASYDNRWIHTERFKIEREVQAPLFAQNLSSKCKDEVIEKASKNTANTNVVLFNRQLLALNEGASPVGIQLSDLSTLGDFTYNGDIIRSLSAHPRFDFKRKELMTYSYLNEDSQLIYYRLNRDNRLLTEKVINWPHPVMLHDFVNTEKYVIFPLFPCTLSYERKKQGKNIFMWEGDELNTWFIITDKRGNEVMRIETDPCYVYHFGNAYEQGDTIIIDAMVSKCTSLMPDRQGKVARGRDCDTRLGRWIIDLKTQMIILNYLDETNGEFPRFDERFNGQPYRYLYIGARARPNRDNLFDRLIRYDLVEQTKQTHCFGEDVPSEPVFVPKSKVEGDGYLLTVVYRTVEDRSDLVILDANNLEAKPLAVVKIPHRIPYGFHGNFISQ